MHDLFVKGNIAAGLQPGLIDGFNIDWEFRRGGQAEFHRSAKEVPQQLNVLAKATGKKYVLTFDSPASRRNSEIDLKAAAAQVDSSPSMVTTTPERGQADQ